MSFLYSFSAGFAALVVALGLWVGTSHIPHGQTVPVGGVATSTLSAITASTTSDTPVGPPVSEVSSGISVAPVMPAVSVPVSSSVAASTSQSTSVSTVALSVYPAGSDWLTTVPLGDGKYVTTAPKKGYIYVCHVQSGGQGAKVNGSWIHGSTWTPSEKISVEGAVSWKNATYSMTIANGIRLIKSNDLPTDRTTGIFPIQSTDPAYQIDQNPASIKAQSFSFSLPANPTPAASPDCIYGEVGVMNNGVMLFDGFDAEYRDALAHEEQDSNQGHPNDEGYHYHGFTSGIQNTTVSEVVGFAFDGYPITGPKLPSGKYLTTTDLDECHGMTSTISLDGKSVSTYHYVLTEDFPYSVSCFKGKSTFTPNGAGAQQTQNTSGSATANSGQQQTQGGTPPAPPQEAIDACTGKATGASCSVGQSTTGMCASIGTYFACKPN